MRRIQTLSLLLLITFFLACSGRNNVESQTTSSASIRKMAPGNCEDCELMFEAMPAIINAVDTSVGWHEVGQKLIISGTVFHADQTTPASDVILYYYHTDQQGFYSPGTQNDRGSQRHGRHRGWIKTGLDGTYSIYTSRPAQYPSNETEAHIHVIIKESDLDLPYWIDGWVFDDDPLLTSQMRARHVTLGGNGIMKTRLEGDVQVANHDVFLGLNVSGYPR